MGTMGRSMIAVAAGLVAGGIALTPAKAADLGGDCCADLEERVAELEAAAVRKGNRKVTLDLSGLVNKMIMYWDDGVNDDVYVVDNSQTETQFRLKGSATLTPGWTAGFIIEIETTSADSKLVDARFDGNPNENTDGRVRDRRASFHVQNDQLGRMTLGREEPVTRSLITLNLADNPIADARPKWANNFHLTRPQGTLGCTGAGCRSAVDLDVLGPNLNTPRADIVRYDSPSLLGLVVSASWGEDDLADLALRYKKEWNSIRLVAGIGYLWDTDEGEAGPSAAIVCPAPAVAPNVAGNCVNERNDLERFAGSASAMHMPTGLYLHGAFAHEQYGVSNSQSHLRASAFPAPVTGEQAEDGTMWYLQAGVKRRLLMPNAGATTLYAEVQQFNDFGVGASADGLLGFATPAGGAPFGEITDNALSIWGLGVVQDIDPAAMKLYAALRLWDPEVRAASVGPAPIPNNGPAGADVSLEDFWAIAFGGRIEF